MITLADYLDAIPGRPSPAEARARASGVRNARRLHTLLEQYGHIPPRANIKLKAEHWPAIVDAMGRMDETAWGRVRQDGNAAVPGLVDALSATIVPPPAPPVVESAPDVTPVATPGDPPAQE